MGHSLIGGKEASSMRKDIVEFRKHRRDEAYSNSNQVEEGVWAWDLS